MAYNYPDVTVRYPIYKVDGVLLTVCPSHYQWALEDISAADAGRTEDTNMDKMRIGQIRKIELQWDYLTTEQAHEVLNAFNPEYITVEYVDPQSGNPDNGYLRSAVFYVGNRSAPMYNAALGLWENVAFNIIERSGR